MKNLIVVSLMFSSLFSFSQAVLEADIDTTRRSFPKNLTVYNGELYFGATNGGSAAVLWRFDGVEAHLAAGDLVFPAFLSVFDGKIFFSADDGVSGMELWSFDGDTAVLEADINPIGGSSVSHLAVYQDKLFFSANSGSGGQELWSFDGDTAIMEANIYNLYAYGSAPKYMFSFNNKLFFTAYDGINGRELWSFNGDTAILEADINPGGGDAFISGHIPYFTAFGDKLYFSATDGTSGLELWSYDGSVATKEAGISLEDEIWEPQFLTVFNGELYFRGDSETYGKELWRFDGNSVSLVYDSFEGSFGSQPSHLTVYNNRLFYWATNSNYESGFRLFCFDGQEVQLCADNVKPGTLTILEGAVENAMMVYNEKLFFKASYYYPLMPLGVGLEELWSYNYTTGIGENIGREEALKVYPNPTNQNIFVDTECLSKDVDIRLCDISGGLILKKHINECSLEISMPSEKGMYVLTVTVSDSYSKVFRVVKL